MQNQISEFISRFPWNIERISKPALQDLYSYPKQSLIYYQSPFQLPVCAAQYYEHLSAQHGQLL